MPRHPGTHVDSPRAVGQRLAETRRKAGLSQRQLAFEGCTPAYISRIESGERIPSLQLLRQLGERLGVSGDWLATGRDAAPAGADPLQEAFLALRLGDEQTAEPILREHVDSPLPERRARALLGLGLLAYGGGDHRETVAQIDAALALDALPPPDHAAALDLLGRALALIGDTERSIATFEDGRAWAEAVGSDSDRLRFDVLLANALVDHDSLDRAAEILAEAIRNPAAAADPLLRARVWWSQARLHTAENNPDLAARYAYRAIAVLEESEHTLYVARAHQLLAHIEIDRHHPEQALELLDTGLPLVRRAGNRYEEAVFEVERARALLQLGHHDDAASVALAAAGLLSGASPADAGRCYALVGEVLAEFHDDARAIEMFELALEHLSPHDRNALSVYGKLAELLERNGRADEALKLLKRAVSTSVAVAPST